jgi:hypothetical protein
MKKIALVGFSSEAFGLKYYVTSPIHDFKWKISKFLAMKARAGPLDSVPRILNIDTGFGWKLAPILSTGELQLLYYLYLNKCTTVCQHILLERR